MSDYPELMNAVSAFARDMEKLQAVTVAQYTPEVEALIATGSRDARQIESTLDRLLDIACHPAGLELFRKLCRYYYTINPIATADYIHAYRDMWDTDGTEAKT